MRELHAMDGQEHEDLPTKDMMNTNQIDFEAFLPVLAKVSELPPTGTKDMMNTNQIDFEAFLPVL